MKPDDRPQVPRPRPGRSAQARPRSTAPDPTPAGRPARDRGAPPPTARRLPVAPPAPAGTGTPGGPGPVQPGASRTSPDEAKLCGLGACLAVFAKRPVDIIRAYVTQAQMAAAADLLRWCAAQRRAYHIVTNEEMARITQSSHHEGICLLVKPPLRITLEQLCLRLAAQTGPVSVLLLEGVTNPHNLGAILRVAAHFGAAAVVQCGETGSVPRLSAAVCRTAEGAAEHVPVVTVNNGRSAIERLRRCALEVVATSSHAPLTLYGRTMPRRCVLLLGSESEGLSADLMAAADATVAIPGSGCVESLNVACAAAVLLAEFRRQAP